METISQYIQKDVPVNSKPRGQLPLSGPGLGFGLLANQRCK